MDARPYIGGQAVIEGVMMRAPRAVAVAVRKPDGRIVVHARPYRPLTQRLPPLRLPLLRGAVVLVESLWLGMGALSWSAEQAVEEEDAGPAGPAGTKEKLAILGTMAVSLLLGLAFFVALPHLLTAGIGWLTGTGLDADMALFHVVDGLIKVALFLGYLWTIGRMPDVQQVFRYHGAEHQSIYAWEAGQALTLENVRPWTRLHPRCGTSFLLFVVLASVAVFTPVFAWMPTLPIEHELLRNLAQIGIKIPLMLPVAGLSYEGIRLSSRLWRFKPARVLALPGMWLQRLTTRPPDDVHLEVAIASLEAAWRCHQAQGEGDLGPEGQAYPTGQAALS